LIKSASILRNGKEHCSLTIWEGRVIVLKISFIEIIGIKPPPLRRQGFRTEMVAGYGSSLHLSKLSRACFHIVAGGKLGQG
jgi:hypothetical protein